MRRLSLRALLSEPPQARGPRVAAVDSSPAPRAPLLSLFAQTYRSVVRHAPLYLLTSLIVVGLEGLVVFTWHSAAATPVASVVLEPFFVTIVAAFSYADLRDDWTPSDVWLRVLERSWAVLLIDLLFQLVLALGIESLAVPDLFSRLMGAAVVMIGVSLVFADVAATVTDDAEPWWWLVPRSLGASMAVAWQRVAFARALIVFALLDLFPESVVSIVQPLLAQHHVPQPAYWANAISVILLSPPFQALCTFVYLDAIGMKRSALAPDDTVK